MRHLPAKFERKFFKEPNSGCWLWTACLNGAGYGRWGVPGAGTQLAHRVSWEFHNGPIPDGLCALHKCDTPACVNPAHLFLGTQLENLADMGRKGRRGGPKVGRKGATNPLARLTEESVRYIRASKEPRNVLAAKFGINRRHVYDICIGRRWGHLR